MLRIVYGLKLDCEVALWTRRIGWRDTTNNGGSELTAKLQRSNHRVRQGHDDNDDEDEDIPLLPPDMKPSAATAHLQGVQRRQEKIREEVDTIDYDKKLVYEGEFKEDSKLSGNPPYLEGCGPSVAVLCVPSGTTTTRYCLEGQLCSEECSGRTSVCHRSAQDHQQRP